MNDFPLVSIRLLCFNQKNYICRAIDSVLYQQTDFKFELIIGDDLSTDGTLEIALKYESHYPNIIKVLKRKQNNIYIKNRLKYGRLYNFSDTLYNCKGKYIALLDGDDYWINSLKLKKQVSVLDTYKNISLCHHEMCVIDDIGKVVENTLKRWNVRNHIMTFSDALKQPIAFTSSAMFLNNKDIIRKFGYFSRWSESGDWCLWVLLCLYGDAFFINEPLGIYQKDVGIGKQINKLKYLKGRIPFLIKLLLNTQSNGRKNKIFKTINSNIVQILKLMMRKSYIEIEN